MPTAKIQNGFRAVYVFDVDQTEGKELPSLTDVRGVTGFRERLIDFRIARNSTTNWNSGRHAINTYSYVKRVEADGVKIRIDHLYTHVDRTLINWLPKKIREKKCATASFGRETNERITAAGQTRLPGNFLFSVRRDEPTESHIRSSKGCWFSRLKKPPRGCV
jgi:hypothetical protein